MRAWLKRLGVWISDTRKRTVSETSQRWNNVGLRAKMSVMVTVGLGGLLTIFALTGINTTSQVTSRLSTERVMLAELSAAALDANLEHVAGLMRVQAGSSCLQSPTAPIRDVITTLRAGLTQLGEHGRGLYLLNNDATLNAQVGDVTWSSEWAVFIASPSLSSSTDFNVSLVPGDHPWALISVPITDEYLRQTGTLVTLVDLSDPAIHPFQQPISLGSTGRVDIVDQYGRVLVSSVDEAAPNSEQAQEIIGEFFHSGATSIRTCQRCNVVDSGEALDEIMAFAPLQSVTWGVLIRENADDVLQPVHRLSLLNLIYGTLSVMGALGLVWVTTSSVIDPIQRITQAAMRIARGDLETPLQLARGDEIGELGRSFDTMRLQLKESIDEIRALNEDLDARVHERTRAALQAQLEAQEARDDLRSVIDALSDELVVVDVDSRCIEQANYAAQQNSGIDISIVGQSCTQTFQRHDICQKTEGGCPIPIVMQTRDSVKITHEFHCPESNRQRFVDIVASPMYDMNGKITRVVELRRDVSDQHMLSESLIRRNQQLSILNSIANTVNQSLDISDILDRALDEVLRLTDIDVGAIFLQSEELGHLELMSYQGMSEDAATLASQFGMLEGSCGGVIELGQVVIVPDINRYRGKRARSLKKESLSSLVHVPLTAKGSTLGSMCVATRCHRSFAEEEQDLLTAIGNQIAVAIENARLYAEVQRREKMRGWLFKRAINAQEEERKRIARELHDETSQALTALIYASEQALILEDREALDDRLESMRNLAQNTLAGVHKLILDLRPTMLDHLGLVPAVRWLATSHLEPKGMKVVVEDNADLKRLPAQFETAVFRVVQETITNIARHSAARNVHILFETLGPTMKIIVEDDGVGFNLEQITISSDDMRGMGLMGMTERVELMGGEFQISSAPGQGTQVSMQVPIKENPNGQK